MTEAECREPEPNALLERLLRRYTGPIGVIDVRHVQAHYERIAGWMEARFPLLLALAARHDLGADAEIGAGAFIYAGHALLRPSDQEVRVPGTPALPAHTPPRGDGMSEKSRLAPVLPGREGGDLEKGAMGTLRAATSSAPPEVERDKPVGRVRRAAPRSVAERAVGEERSSGDGETPTDLDPLAISGSIAARRSVDPHTSNVVQNHFQKSGSPFSLREKARMREIKSNSFVEDFDPLTPTLSRREREKKTVPVSKGQGSWKGTSNFKNVWPGIPISQERGSGGGDGGHALAPSSILPRREGAEEKTTGYAQDLPPSAADPVTMARTSPVPQEVTPARTVWHVRRAAPGITAAPSLESTPSPDQTLDLPHTPAVGAPPRGRPQREYSNVIGPDALARGGETPAGFDPLSISPLQRARKDGDIPIGYRGSAKLSLPQAALVRSKGALDDLRQGAPSSRSLALGVPMDPRALPLARVRTPAANVDRAMDVENPRLQASALLHAPSLDMPRRGLRSGVTESPPVLPASVPIPERPRLRLSKREWARLIERVSRLIRHRLAVDLDRRGIRSWR